MTLPRRNAHPEHDTQINCKKFCTENIIPLHRFLAFDRSGKTSQFQHEYQRRRGMVAGTADTLVRVKDFAPLWIEVKRKGEKPTESQRLFGVAMMDVGDAWAWADSVMMYGEALEAHGILLRATWRINAEHLDLLLLGHAMKRKGVGLKSYRKPKRRGPLTAREQRAAMVYANAGKGTLL